LQLSCGYTPKNWRIRKGFAAVLFLRPSFPQIGSAQADSDGAYAGYLLMVAFPSLTFKAS
jgi:hypothetical protein